MGYCASCLPALTGTERATIKRVASFLQPGWMQLVEMDPIYGLIEMECTIESHKARRCSKKSLDSCHN